MTNDPEKAASNGEAEGERVAEATQADSASTPPPAASTPPPAPSVPPAAASPEQRLAETQAEAARLRDQLLRTAADFDNFRKRSRREQDDAQRRGREGMIKDLLPVFDNLERAIQHAESMPDVKVVADGLRMVAKQFVDTLEKLGVKRIAAVGKPFDPSQHEAIQHLASAEHPAGVVVAEVQPGYQMGDHLIRAAMVVVSKGPPEVAN
jgi:molecular chaperone GrpE